jgi:SNF2 family DNA or RNA helicase
MLTRADLHEYQRATVSFALAARRVNLWLDLGLGKTVSTLTVISDTIDNFDARRWLVVAPLRVAKFTWPAEIDGWEHLRHLRISPIIGTQKERLAALQNWQADIHVINFDNLPWLFQKIGGLQYFPYDGVVIDEASQVKNPDTRRFKVLKQFAVRSKYWLNLTATPTPNSVLEVWPQTYLLDSGRRLGRTVTGFREAWAKENPFTGKLEPIKGADAGIRDAISDVTFRLDGKGVVDLPEKVEIDVPVELDADELEKYQRLERDLVLRVTPDQTIEALSAAALLTKLLQICNGSVYDAEGVSHHVHDRKIEALREIAEENDEPIWVCYWFKSDLERLQAAFPDAVLLDKNVETLAKWNRGEIKMLLAHPQSSSHGINGQKGGSLQVWFSLTWSLELYQQMVGRLHRQGQTKPVRVLRLVARNTVDDMALGVLSRKRKSQDALLDGMRQMTLKHHGT